MAARAKIIIKVVVNGKRRTLTAHPMQRLLDVLREELRLTGTKEGCGEGECGACAVMLDGRLVNSCLVPVSHVQGRKVRTIEGLETGGRLHRVQQAFLDCGGAQCGICTPGMILAAASLLEKKKKPNDSEVREWLAGNLCRCTGFKNIFDSVARAASSGGKSS